jgi:predicted TIM-barrel fold metal-dependent hydrolase
MVPYLTVHTSSFHGKLMIVDSHVYCFEPADTPAGHASAEDHLKWLQAAHAGHHQPAFRTKDRTPGSSQVLDPDRSRDLEHLPDVNFRVDRACGRFVWDYEGEEYTKHFYPPNLRDLEFTPFSLNCEMDYADVDMALIHTDPMLGRDSAYLAACVERFPERLRSMAPVDEWRIIAETDAVIKELDTAINEHGLHAIKFIPPLAYLSSETPWDDGPYRPFWEAATKMGIPVFFTLGSGPVDFRSNTSIEELKQGYIDELRLLMRWMERYPDTVCSLTHGFPWRLYLEEGRIVLPQEVWEPFVHPNCNLEVCLPVRLGDLFDFPYREVWPVLAAMVEHVGADHLLWGTDMPFQNRFCTYRQSRQWIEKYCDFLSAEDLALIMGGTVARILAL